MDIHVTSGIIQFSYTIIQVILPHYLIVIFLKEVTKQRNNYCVAIKN